MAENKDRRILIVDDEEALLQLMQTFLTRLGYQVTTSATAHEAAALFEQQQPPFDMVITDLSLPDRKGHELGLDFVKQDAHVRVLLCSGYPFDTVAFPKDIRNRFGVLQKPFLPKMLSETVEELLWRPAA